jgi:hypothetical protein
MAIILSPAHHFFDSLRFQAITDGSNNISKVRGHIFEILMVRLGGMEDMRFLWKEDIAESSRAGWWKYRWLRVITPFRKGVELMAHLESFNIDEGRVF